MDGDGNRDDAKIVCGTKDRDLWSGGEGSGEQRHYTKQFEENMQLFMPGKDELFAPAADASMRAAQLAGALLGPFNASDHEVRSPSLSLAVFRPPPLLITRCCFCRAGARVQRARLSR
jgi:hypothetical protein